jgi:hypothetical protein
MTGPINYAAAQARHTTTSFDHIAILAEATRAERKPRRPRRVLSIGRKRFARAYAA